MTALSLPMARKICDFLNINRADDELTAAIDTQSFHHKKQMLLADNQQGKAVLLRRGRSGEWKETLPADNVRRIEAELGDFMAELGYAV